MRLSLFAFAAVVALTASGCDSTGIDSPTCTTNCGGGTTPGGGGTTPGGGGTTPGGGGTTPAFTFAPVNPAATYLRTDQSTADATPLLLADYGLTAGERVCFRTAGDFYYAPGLLASTRGGESLATGVFSASNVLNASTERVRVKDAIDGDWDIVTAPTFGTAAETNIDEDFNVTDDCWTVPAGATHLFLSAYDDSFLDNSDASAGGQEFGVFVTGSN